MSVNHIELSLEEIRHYLEGSNINVFVFLDNTKASEFYIRTQFIQDDDFSWTTIVPYIYRRTGLELKNEKDIADYLGITVQFYSQIERGINTLSYANAIQIAAWFGMTTDELFEKDYLQSDVLMPSIAEERMKKYKKKERTTTIFYKLPAVPAPKTCRSHCCAPVHLLYFI